MKLTFTLIFLSCIFSQSLLHSQDLRNSPMFQNSFDTETQDMPGKKNKKIPSSYFAYIVPQTFWNVALNNDSICFGISDMQPDTAIAKQQAILRAKGLAALMQQNTIQSKGDYFTNELNQRGTANKHISLTLVNHNKAVESPKIQVISTLRTPFHETLVLARILPEKEQNLNVSAELFISETVRDYQRTLQQRSSFSINELEPFPMYDSLLYHLQDGKYLIQASFNGLKSELRIFPKYGQDSTQTIRKEDLMQNYSYSSLTHGFWNGFITALLRELKRSSALNARSSKLNDVHQRMVTNLGSEMTTSENRFYIEDIKIVENKIFMRCQVTELNP